MDSPVRRSLAEGGSTASEVGASTEDLRPWPLSWENCEEMDCLRASVMANAGADSRRRQRDFGPRLRHSSRLGCPLGSPARSVSRCDNTRLGRPVLATVSECFFEILRPGDGTRVGSFRGRELQDARLFRGRSSTCWQLRFRTRRGLPVVNKLAHHVRDRAWETLTRECGRTGEGEGQGERRGEGSERELGEGGREGDRETVWAAVDVSRRRVGRQTRQTKRSAHSVLCLRGGAREEDERAGSMLVACITFCIDRPTIGLEPPASTPNLATLCSTTNLDRDDDDIWDLLALSARVGVTLRPTMDHPPPSVSQTLLARSMTCARDRSW